MQLKNGSYEKVAEFHADFKYVFVFDLALIEAELSHIKLQKMRSRQTYKNSKIGRSAFFWCQFHITGSC